MNSEVMIPMLHEQKVRQTGLEKQNEELLRSMLHLEKSADFTFSLICSMQDGLSVLDTEGVTIYVNPAFCQMTGFLKEELIGVGPPHPYWPPKEYPRIQLAFEEAINSLSSSFELIFMRKNGQRFPVLISAFAVLDRNGETSGYAATVKDITLQKEAEKISRDWNKLLKQRVDERTAQLHQSLMRLHQLADAAFEGIAVSEGGKLLDGNPQFAKLFGYDLVELVGRDLIQLVAPESRNLVAAHIHAESEVTYQFDGLRKDGTVFPIEARSRLGIGKDRSLRFIALRDLTASRSAEEILGRQSGELIQAQHLAMVGEIAIGIIHQLGQPLSSMGVNLMAAIARLDECSLKNCSSLAIIQDVESDLARMREFMRHLKALAHPEHLNRMPVDLNVMVKESLRILRREIDSHGIRVVVDIGRNLPLVQADKVQLSQVVLNLMRNAIDACVDCPPERRELVLATRELAGASVELSVRDTGSGISPEAIARMFTPLFSTKKDGLGIGLRLSRTIVEVHGGTIVGCNNTDGIGAIFRVTLPAGPAENYTKV